MLLKIYEECKKDIPDFEKLRKHKYYGIKTEEYRALSIAMKKLQTKGYIEGVNFFSSVASHDDKGNVIPPILQMQPFPHINITLKGEEKIKDILGIQKISTNKEKVQDFREYDMNIKKSNSNVSSNNFWNLIHKDIKKVSEQRFKANFYSDAVFAAVKELESQIKEIVKTKTGEEHIGENLMHRAFKANKSQTPPSIITLEDISTKTGENIQEGYHFLFAGVMKAIRNPKAHANIDITKENGIHLIFMVSHLMYTLDKATY